MIYKGFIISIGIIISTNNSYEGLKAVRHGIRIEAPYIFRLDIIRMEQTIDELIINTKENDNGNKKGN